MIKKIAIIELGSNAIRTVRFLITPSNIEEESLQRYPLRLLGNLGKNSEISPETTRKVADLINDFVKESNDFEIYAIATAALRNADNKNEFIKNISSLTKVKINVIPSEKEAYYDYLAVNNKIGLSSMLIADVGGGSTELIGIENGEMIGKISIPLGGVNITNQYFREIPVSQESLELASKAFREQLSLQKWLKNFKHPMVLLGGASIVLFNLLHKTDFVISKLLVDKIVELRKYDIRELNKLATIPAGTIDVINGGLTIIEEIIKYAQPEKTITIKASVREGFLLDQIQKDSR